MWQRMGRFVLLGVLAVVYMSVVAPEAGATVTATLTLDQSAGTAAGSFANLGTDLKFASPNGDTPQHLTLNLPSGLLANASIDGGACLLTADLNDSACEVGSGVVTADLLGFIPTPTQVTFDLVPPPAAGDLAGLAVNSNGTQIGTTGDIKVRPSGDPAGVGVTIALTLPNSLSGVPITIAEINSTFDALRYPTSCPATPQSLTATVDSYNSDSTLQTVTAPLSVTGCSALPYAPAFKVTAVRDRTDRQRAPHVVDLTDVGGVEHHGRDENHDQRREDRDPAARPGQTDQLVGEERQHDVEQRPDQLDLDHQRPGRRLSAHGRQ